MIAGWGKMSLDTGTTYSFATLFGAGQSVTGIGFYGTIAAGIPASEGVSATTRTLRIDNLSIVPEPGSMVLLGASLAGFGVRRRR